MVCFDILVVIIDMNLIKIFGFFLLTFDIRQKFLSFLIVSLSYSLSDLGSSGTSREKSLGNVSFITFTSCGRGDVSGSQLKGPDGYFYEETGKINTVIINILNRYLKNFKGIKLHEKVFRIQGTDTVF